MKWLRFNRYDGWHIDRHDLRRGVWGYRTPWGAWYGWRKLNKPIG